MRACSGADAGEGHFFYPTWARDAAAKSNAQSLLLFCHVTYEEFAVRLYLAFCLVCQRDAILILRIEVLMDGTITIRPSVCRVANERVDIESGWVSHSFFNAG